MVQIHDVMELRTRIKQTSLAMLGTTFVVPGAIAILFGFSAATSDPFECGIQLPYWENIGHPMTALVLFVCGFAGVLIGLLFFWFFSQQVRRNPDMNHNKAGSADG